MALSSDGIVYVWGSNGEGALGLGDELMGPNAVDHIIPMKIDQNSFNGKKVTRIAAGFHFSAAVTEDGKLYTWYMIRQTIHLSWRNKPNQVFTMRDRRCSQTTSSS